MTLTFHTRWCPRMFADVPYKGCRCMDCRAIGVWRWMRRLWR